MSDKMTEQEAIDFFSELYYGQHHIPGPNCKPKKFGWGWCVNHLEDLSTFDFNTLTRLVFLAHDRCVRAEILNSGPNRVKIAIWKRYARTGSSTQRHPTIEEALKTWREKHPSSEII